MDTMRFLSAFGVSFLIIGAITLVLGAFVISLSVLTGAWG